VLEVSGLPPPPATQRIAGQPATDCMIGERQWQDMFER